MSKHLQRDLEKLEQALLALSANVEEMIRKACRALRESRLDLIGEVLTQEDATNSDEVHIEEECLKILALHQPVAIDLRRVATVLKINTDLERIADLAVNIGERAHWLATCDNVHVPERLEEMSRHAIAMVRESLDAFVELNPRLARDVCHRDDVVDDLNREVIEELTATMRADSESIPVAMQLFSASRHIERIADHATNIAEDVIYLVEGEIARHKTEQFSARE